MSETAGQNLFVELHALVSYAPSNLNRDDLGAPKTAVFGGVRRLRISSQCQKRSWRMADIFRDELKTERDRIGVRTSRLGEEVGKRLGNAGLSEVEQRGFRALLASIGKKDAATGDDKKPAGDDDEEREEASEASPTETAHLLYLSDDEHAAVAAFIRKERDALARIGEYLDRATKTDAEATKAVEAAMGTEPTKAAADPSSGGEDKVPKRAKKGRTTGKTGKSKTDDANRTKAGEEINKLRERFKKHLVGYVPRSAVDVALFGRFLTESEFREIDAAMQVAHALGTQKAEVEYDYFTAMDDRSGEAAAGHIGETELGASVFYKYAACDTALLCENLGPSAEETKHADKSAKEDPEAKKKVDAHRSSARAVAARAMKGIAFAVARVVPTGKRNSTAPQSPADYLEVAVRRDAPVSLVNAFLKPVRAERESDVMDVSIKELRELADKYDKMYASDAKAHRFVLSSREVTLPKGAERCDSLEQLGEKLEALLLRELPT